MKKLKDIITERLHLGKTTKLINNDYFTPKTKDEFETYLQEQCNKVKNSDGTYGQKENPVDLSYIDFSKLAQSNNEFLSYYFFGNDTIIYLNMESCNFNGMVDIGHMFEESSIKEINISYWELGNNIKVIQGLFLDCFELEKIYGIEDFLINKYDNIESLTALFKHCKKLKNLDLSKWDVSNIYKFSSMFAGCQNLISIGDVSKWNTESGQRFLYMFKECFNLKDIPGIDKWNMRHAIKIKGMFLGDANLNINIDNWTINTKHINYDDYEIFDGTNIKPTWYNE